MNSITKRAFRLNTDTEITNFEPFIIPANLLITDKLSAAGFSAEYLAVIETWLAAHFAAVSEREVRTEQLGDANVTYTGKEGEGLNATRFGKQAKVLDTSGILAKLGAKQVLIEFMGDDDSV